MEVLLVLVILVVLASMAVTMFRGTQEKADQGRRRRAGRHLQDARSTCTSSTPSNYPSGLKDLVDQAERRQAGRIAGPGRTWTRSPRDPWDNEYRIAAPGKHNPDRSTSGRPAPTARTAATTTSATGNVTLDRRPMSNNASRRIAPQRPDARRSVPGARAAGGDRAHCRAADWTARSRVPRCTVAAICCAAPGPKARLAAMQSGQTYVFRFEPNGSRFQIVTLDAIGLPRDERAARRRIPTRRARGRPTCLRLSQNRLPDGVIFAAGDVASSSQVWPRCRTCRPGPGRARSCFAPTARRPTPASSLSNDRQQTIRVTLRGLTGISNASDVGDEAVP